MLIKLLRAPIRLFLRHEAWAINAIVREPQGLFIPTTITGTMIGLIMLWGILGTILIMGIVVILPWSLGAEDTLITTAFIVISSVAGLAWWVWAMHWMVILFALKFGHGRMAMLKQERAQARLARWQGVNVSL